MKQASASIIMDYRSVKKDGRYPVKVSVYYDKNKDRYPTGVDLTKEEWEKIHSERLKDNDLKDIRIKLDGLLTKAKEILKNMNTFSFDVFSSLFSTDTAALTNADNGEKKIVNLNFVENLFTQYSNELKANGQISTGRSHVTTRNSLILFKKNITFADLTSDFLKSYEDFFRLKGHTNATIGINLRNVRTICNEAIRIGLMQAEKYPFKNYTIPTGQNVKKALPADKLKSIIKYKPTSEDKTRALNFWLFSYVSNGMNMADIARLKKTDIETDFFAFHRVKTIRTKKKDLTPIKVAIHPIAKKIIDSALRKNNDPENPYLFDILSPGLSALTEKNRIQKFIKFVNANMKEIAGDLKINLTKKNKLTTYSARHSFATILKRKGVPIDEISEFLGHSNIIVTKNYLDSFADETLKKRSKLLTKL